MLQVFSQPNITLNLSSNQKWLQMTPYTSKLTLPLSCWHFKTLIYSKSKRRSNKALGSVTKDFERWIRKLGIAYNIGVMQKTALLGTARILWKVLDFREMNILLAYGHLL